MAVSELQEKASRRSTELQTSAELRRDCACSFCRKGPDEVAKLVAGPGVYICNECVGLSAETHYACHRRPRRRSRWSRLGAAAVRRGTTRTICRRVAAASAQVEQQLTGWVRQARSRGLTWTRIGEALGMTRQSAWERFSGED